MRLRREQDALTPTEKAIYEETLEELLGEDLDDMLEEIEGPEQVFEPPETERPAQSESPPSQPAGSDPAHSEVKDSEMGQAEVPTEPAGTSEAESVTHLAAKIAMQKKLTEIELATAKAELEGLLNIRADNLFLRQAQRT